MEKFVKAYSKWAERLGNDADTYDRMLPILIRASSIYFGVEEEWRIAEETGGRYFVSNFGRVRNVGGTVYRKDGIVSTTPECIRKIQINMNGYANLMVWIDGKTIGLRTHRMVANAFIDNPLGKSDVNHKDSNRVNNMVLNLEWATRSENLQHGFDSGNHIPTWLGKFGYENHSSKAVVQLTMDDEYIAEYGSAREACRATGASPFKVSLVCNGKRNSHYGYKWMFADDYYRWRKK